MKNLQETFTYDDMNRLTGITLKRSSGQDLHCGVSYDALGRMTSKQAVTAVNGTPQVSSVFSQPAFDATKIHAINSAQSISDLFSATAQTVTYTGFDKVSKVKQGNDSICYTYGYDHQRIRMEEHVGNTVRTKHYVGMCEYVTEANGTESWTYLTGPYGVFAVVEKQNGVQTPHYILKDNLGSWTTITDGDGTVERLSYDAWGRRRNTTDFGYDNVSHTFDRGYTLHEHYDDFDLINMNGRLYDPILGRMLSPDIVIQDEQSSQAYNRYSYCFNNPLRFTDPSGYVVRGYREYVDWHYNMYLDFGSHRSNGSAFNTDLSEGKFSPIYDENGYFLGTDDRGLQGEAIVMRRADFKQGMRHDDALALATDLAENNREEAEIRMNRHYASLRNRPDYDGFVTIDEGIAWAKSHIGALDHPTPDNMLYINTALLDFGNLSIGDFYNGEGNISPINLFNTHNTIHSITNPILRSTVYALGRVDCYLDNATIGMFHIVNDYNKHYGRATDYDWNGGGGVIRSNAIRFEKKRSNLPNSAGFRVYYYGVGFLK